MSNKLQKTDLQEKALSKNCVNDDKINVAIKVCNLFLECLQ